MVSLVLDSPALAEQYDRVSDAQFNHGKLLIKDLRIARGQSVLDVGCGTGRLGAYVAEIVAPRGEVVGIDPLPLRIDIAQRKAVPGFYAQVGQAENLSAFDDARFDAVYYNSVFHWIPEKTRPLREAHRVLKAGGVVGISTAAKEQPHQFAGIVKALLEEGRLGDYANGAFGTPHTVDADELRALFDQAGFSARQLEIRSFVDVFASAEEVFEFNQASAFGNFLAALPPDKQLAARTTLADALEGLRTDAGIRLQRNLIFAVAQKEA